MIMHISTAWMRKRRGRKSGDDADGPPLIVHLQTKEEMVIADFAMKAVSIIIIISGRLRENCTSLGYHLPKRFSRGKDFSMPTIKSHCRRNGRNCDLPRNFYNVCRVRRDFREKSDKNRSAILGGEDAVELARNNAPLESNVGTGPFYYVPFCTETAETRLDG